tara:strand:- start:218 stop:910 length:693 start_codon:yes stop_codon:yes gene_type:complete
MKKEIVEQKKIIKAKAIELFGTDPNMTSQRAAEMIGVSVPTIARWRSDPNFWEAVDKISDTYYSQYHHAVVMKVIEQALEGDPKSQDMFLKMRGKLADKNINVRVLAPFEQFLKGNEKKDDLEEVFDVTDVNYKEVDKDNIKEDNIKTLNEIKSDFKKIKRNEKQKSWYMWRKRAEKVGIKPLKNKRPTYAERSKWEKRIINAESRLLAQSPHSQEQADNNKTPDKDSSQ